MPDGRIASVEIDDDYIKVVEAENVKGGKRICGLICKPISLQDPENAAAQIKEVFQSFKTMPEHIMLNIPRHLVTARFIKIPSVVDEEISKIMKLESIKHLPYTDEDVIYGYRTIEKMDDGYSRVLLVIAQSESVNKVIGILNKAGIKGLSFLSLSSEALYSWYMLATEGKEKENAMIVNLDLGHMDIDIIEENKLVFTRGIAYDTKDARISSKAASEIEISINNHRKESSRSIGKVILTGRSAGSVDLKLALSKKIKIPIEIIDQKAGMPIGEDVKIEDENVSFAEPLGLLLRTEDIMINLVPPEAREEAQYTALRTNIITAVFLGLLFIVIVFGIFVKKLHDRYVYMSYINTQLKAIGPGVESAKKMLKDTKIIQEMMARKPLAVDVLSDVYTITPASVSLNMIGFERGKELVLRGGAPELSEILKYVAALEKSSYFEGVKVKYANKRIVEGRETVDFEIDAMISKMK